MSARYQSKFDRENRIGSIIGTLGGSDVIQMFVHDVASSGNVAELEATLPGFEKYSERSLIFARSDDLVCVLSRVDDQYLEFLSDLGVGPESGNIIVASEDVQPNCGTSLLDLLISNNDALSTIRKLIGRDKKIVLNPYLVSTREFKLAVILEGILGKKVHLLGGNPDIVDYANRKHNVRTKALELGVPIPEGDIVELQTGEGGKPLDLTPIRVSIDRHIRKTGRVVIKGSYGFSGSSIVIVENNPESIEKSLSNIAERADNRVYLVEVMLDIIVSPNVLMYIEPDNGGIFCVGVTDQILSGNLMHQGNVYPSGAKTLRGMINSAQEVSKWLQAEGYNGLVGFDFIEYLNPGTGRFEHSLAEVNPRINAAAYPKSLIEHLNRKQRQKGGPYIEAFLSTKVETKASSFAKLEELYGRLFFKPETGKGIVPYNIGCLEHGKFNLAIFGESRNEFLGIYEDFKKLQPIES